MGQVIPMLEKFNSRTFSECLNTPFRIRVAGREPLTIELIEVEDVSKSPRHEEFSLLFRGPVSPYALQAIHHIEHDRLGEFDLFLVPLGPDGQGMRYEAVFNRFRESGNEA